MKWFIYQNAFDYYILLLLFSNSFSFIATFAIVVVFFFHLVYFQQSVSRWRAGRGGKNGRDDTGRLKKELKRLQFLTVGSACRMEGVILKNFTRTPIN